MYLTRFANTVSIAFPVGFHVSLQVASDNRKKHSTSLLIFFFFFTFLIVDTTIFSVTVQSSI